MRTFNYTPSSPFSGKLTNLGISLVMIVFPLVAPFGIRIGSMRILGPTAVTILFVAGGAVLLLCTLLEIRKARALAAAGGRITIDGDRVTFPVVRKGAVTEETLLIRRSNARNSTRRRTNSKSRCRTRTTPSTPGTSTRRRSSRRSAPSSKKPDTRTGRIPRKCGPPSVPEDSPASAASRQSFSVSSQNHNEICENRLSAPSRRCSPPRPFPAR